MAISRPKTVALAAGDSCLEPVVRLLAAGLLLTAVPASAQVVDVVAFRGDLAADGNGVLNGADADPVINDEHEVVFLADYVQTSGGANIDDRAAVMYKDGTYAQLLRRGSAAGDGNGVVAEFFRPSLSNDGTAAFYATFSDSIGGLADDAGIVTALGGVATVAVREGEMAPGGGDFTIFNANSNSSLAMDGAGRIGLLADVMGSPPGRVILRASGTTLEEFARRGEAMPGGPGVYGLMNLPAINGSGAMAFKTSVESAPPASYERSAIVRSDGIAATEVVRPNAAAPDGNGNLQFLDDAVAISDAGQVAFAASFSGTSGGSNDAFAMLVYDDTNPPVAPLRVVARSGDPALDGNGSIRPAFDAFGAPRVNSFGDVAFKVQYSGTANGPLDDDAIVRGFPTPQSLLPPLTPLVREGQLEPGGDGEFFNISEPIGMTQSATVLFESNLRNTASGSGGADRQGVYLSDGVDVVEVARSGDVIEGAEIQQLVTSPYGVHEGALNESGQVVFSAQVRRNFQIQNAIFLFTPDLYFRDAGGSTNWDAPGHPGEVGVNRNGLARANWTLSIVPSDVHNVFIDGDHVGYQITAVANAGLDTMVRRLTIRQGGALAMTGGAIATLEGILVGDGGKVSGHGALVGDVVVDAGGEFLPDAGATLDGEIVNDGLLGVRDNFNGLGPTQFNGNVVNNAQAEVRSNQFIGPVESHGLFQGDFQNGGSFRIGEFDTAEIFGDYRGPGTIQNDGTLIFHGGFFPGASPLYGEIGGSGATTLGAGAVIEIGGAASGASHGDPLAQFDSVHLVDGGSFNVAGDLQISLIDGFLPAESDAFLIFEAGSLSGLFDNAAPGSRLSTVDGTGTFLVNYGPTSSFDPHEVWLTDFLTTSFAPSDVDHDGDVDGADFLIIQRSDPSLVAQWQQQFGAMPTLAAVAEPASVVLTLLCVAVLLCRTVSRWPREAATASPISMTPEGSGTPSRSRLATAPRKAAFHCR